jgi:hypothetical protein
VILRNSFRYVRPWFDILYRVASYSPRLEEPGNEPCHGVPISKTSALDRPGHNLHRAFGGSWLAKWGFKLRPMMASGFSFRRKRTPHLIIPEFTHAWQINIEARPYDGHISPPSKSRQPDSISRRLQGCHDRGKLCEEFGGNGTNPWGIQTKLAHHWFSDLAHPATKTASSKKQSQGVIADTQLDIFQSCWAAIQASLIHPNYSKNAMPNQCNTVHVTADQTPNLSKYRSILKG